MAGQPLLLGLQISDRANGFTITHKKEVLWSVQKQQKTHVRVMEAGESQSPSVDRGSGSVMAWTCVVDDGIGSVAFMDDFSADKSNSINAKKCPVSSGPVR